MSDLPPPIADYLHALIERTRRPAWLRIDRDGQVSDLGGELAAYHLDTLRIGDRLEVHLPFLQGMLPLDGAAVVLPMLTAEPLGCVDVHLVPDGMYDYLILLDSREEAERLQLTQQKMNEAMLAIARSCETTFASNHAPDANPVPAPLEQRDSILRDLPAALDMLVVEAVAGDAFRLIEPAPQWYLDFVRSHDLQPNLIELFPVLEIVLPDAQLAWARGEMYRSDVWTESAPAGSLIHLQATALTLRSRRLLLIARIEADFGQRQAVLQKARERRLQFDKEISAADDAKTRAEAANRGKSQFLANMSHELRSPLASILGFSELLAEQAVAEGDLRGAADMQKIRAAGKHLLSLIDEVLTLSRAEAGRVRLTIEEFEVHRLTNDVLSIVAPLAAKNGNAVNLQCPNDPGVMRSDAMKIRQCLLNLVGNAVKFTRDGTIQVTLRRFALVDGPQIEWSVQDTGIGITPEQMTRLFQPFSQADPSIARTYGGSGLGLALSQHYCRLLGGEITVKSQAGAGATFTMTLPARLASETGGAS